MANPKLKVKKRNVFGRKVKKLRAEGILPANIYGKKIKSQAVQLELAQFAPVYREVRETGLVDLLLDKEVKVRPVLVHNVQLDPVSGKVIHADFHQVSLTEKITAPIPVELVGVSEVSEQKLGILVRLLDEVEVEALPADLPERIEVDISSLKKVGDMIKVGEIKTDKKKVKLVTDLGRLVAKVEPLTKVEEEKAPVAEEPVEEEEAAVEGEKKTEEGAEVKKGEEKPKEKPEKKPKEKPAEKASKKKKEEG